MIGRAGWAITNFWKGHNMKRIIFNLLIIATLLTGCGPSEADIQAAIPTATETPVPTKTPTPTITPTPTNTPIPKVSVRICAIQADGKATSGAYIQVSDANFKQIIPDDGTTGIQAPGSGCLTVKLPPGSYHIRSQKVINPYEELYISGGADIDVVLSTPLKIEIELVTDG